MIVWEWLKKWWRWLLLGLALLVAFLAGILFPKPQPTVSPSNEKKKDEEEKAKKLEEELKVKEQETLEAEKRKHDVAVSDQQKELEKKTEGLKEDIVKTNEYLHQVGDRVQE